MSKISVIGVGNLGSCISYEVANRGIVDELVLVDIYRDLAEGNAEDITQAMAFRNNVKVYAGEYDDVSGSDVVVVTAGKPRTSDMKTRMDLLNVNKRIIKDVASKLKRLEGDFVVVTLTNPVDLINYLMWRYTGFDRRRVIGSAGQLDTARFRTVLSRRYKVPVLDVKAYVIGEHGDKQVPLFSMVELNGKRRIFSKEEQMDIREGLRKSALEVISKKGATVYAPANNTVNVIQSILEDEKELAVCSAVLQGEYGLSDLSIGVPVIIGRNGIKKVLEWKLDEEERSVFYQGAERLKKTIKILKIS